MAIQLQQLITPLVLTPQPRKHESLKGYILRVSEMNGYSNPTVMLNAAGMNANEMGSIIPPLNKLAPLLNTKVVDLTKLGYRKSVGMTSAKHIWINNHQLPTYHLNIKSPKICTECILENGFIESFCDLKYAIACPKHGQLLLKSCPNCNKQLTWNRPGLLICKCGSDLSQHNGKQISNPVVLGLLSFIRNQLKRDVQDFKLLEDKFGFPVDHLSKLTLGELLSIIGKLDRQSVNVCTSATEQWDENLLFKASIALKQWPEGLYEYLDYFNSEGASTEGFGLRKQFESFCGSLFKSKIPQEKMLFIKNAFIDYGNQRWKQGYIFNKQKAGSNVLGIYGLAKILDVTPSTAKNLVKKGLIPFKTSQLNGRTRQFFDISNDLPIKSTTGTTFTLRIAAAWLGLPTSVLKILREQGEFVVKHIAKPYSAYHFSDLLVFRDRLFKDELRKCCFVPDIHITLKHVMQMKTGSPQIKANVIKAILNTELIPLGSLDASIKGLFFYKEHVQQFINTQKVSLFGFSTVANAAKELHCDPLVVKSLALDGILLSESKPNGLFIQNTSIQDFRSQYVSCAFIAKKYKTSTHKILDQCEKKR